MAAQLRVCLVLDVLNGSVHGDGFHLRQLIVYCGYDLRKFICRKHERVAVLKKHPLDAGPYLCSFFEIRFDLFHRANREFHVRVHRTERAFVMAAPKRHLQKQGVRFVGRAVNHPGQIHLPLPPFIRAMYAFPQVSIAAMTG